MKNKVWEEVVRFYNEKFGIDTETVNIIADYDILTLYMDGISTDRIGDFFEIEPAEVTKTIQRYFTGLDEKQRYEKYEQIREKIEHDWN